MDDNRISLALIVLIVIAIVLGGDGFSNISGHVYDANEKPIVNAKVLFEAEDSKSSEHPEYTRSETETNSDGRFGAGFTHAPFDIKLRLTVTKEGFQPYVTEFRASDARKMVEDKHELKIMLEKETQE